MTAMAKQFGRPQKGSSRSKVRRGFAVVRSQNVALLRSNAKLKAALREQSEVLEDLQLNAIADERANGRVIEVSLDDL